jgi:hypothetical protein
MMRGRSLTMAMTLLLLAPLQLMAQAGGQGRGAGQQGPGGALMTARTLLEHGSVEYLADKAADLQLTVEQAQALKAIGASWSEETKSSRSRIQAVMPAQGQPMGGGGDRQALMMQMQELMPVMQKLVDDDGKALGEAMKLLSEPQQATARRLLDERRESMRPRRGG